MKRKILMFIFAVVLACVPALAQETLYPVRSSGGVDILTPDHLSFVVENPFKYRFTLGSPPEDYIHVVPKTRARTLIFWLRIDNLSDQPLPINITTFSCVDDQGKTCRLLTPDQAFDRMIAEPVGARKILRNLVNDASVGVADKQSETDARERDEMMQFSLNSGQIAVGGVRHGVIYFEEPPQKNFTVKITLGDLWPKPIMFTNVKPKS